MSSLAELKVFIPEMAIIFAAILLTLKTVAILALFFFFYNTTLRGETTGPLIFMLLAMPEVAKKNFLYEQQNK